MYVTTFGGGVWKGRCSPEMGDKTMRRRDFLRGAAGAGAGIGAADGPSPRRPSRRARRRTSSSSSPTTSAGATSAATATRTSRRRNLDRLARQGTLFTQFYVNRLGLLAQPHGLHDRPLPRPPRHPRPLRQPTSRTRPAACPTGSTRPCRPSRGCSRRPATRPPTSASGTSAAARPRRPRRLRHRRPPHRQRQRPDVGREGRATSAPSPPASSSTRRIRFIEANKDRPFYVNLWTLRPARHAQSDRRADEALRAASPPTRGVPLQERGADLLRLRGQTWTTQIGRLLDELDELGLADNTLVVFSSDNGPEDIHIRNAAHSGIGSPGPFRGRKRSLYEGGIRMPFIVRWPGRRPAGQRRRHVGASPAVDLLPDRLQAGRRPCPTAYQPDGEDVSDILLRQGQRTATSRSSGNGASASSATPSTRAPCSRSATATGSC